MVLWWVLLVHSTRQKAELDKEFINAPEQPFWLTI
jgi:hypothetical protein